jgi:NADH:ubiquinone oxidoreductase subunit 6 (subunit J)
VNTRQINAWATAISAIALLLIVLGSIISVNWLGTYTQFTSKDLGMAIFETWGPTLIIVGLLMFASMLGGVYIAQEDRE